MKIYTRKGDGGTTGIWGGRRLDKDAARIEAIGAVDECNAAIGTVIAVQTRENETKILADVQDCLFVIGCELMAPDREGPGASVPRLSREETSKLERAIDDLEEQLPPLTNFIHPTGTPAAAALHLARAICRRAERRVTTLRRTEPVDDQVVAYLNRLADLLFVLARNANFTAGFADRTWNPTQ